MLTAAKYLEAAPLARHPSNRPPPDASWLNTPTEGPPFLRARFSIPPPLLERDDASMTPFTIDLRSSEGRRPNAPELSGPPRRGDQRHDARWAGVRGNAGGVTRVESHERSVAEMRLATQGGGSAAAIC